MIEMPKFADTAEYGPHLLRRYDGEYFHMVSASDDEHVEFVLQSLRDGELLTVHEDEYYGTTGVGSGTLNPRRVPTYKAPQWISLV